MVVELMNNDESRKAFRIPLFCLVTVLFWFSMYTYVPILSTYVEHLGASNLMAGIIVGSYGFTQMVLRIPIGIASDRIHKRKLFINFGFFLTLFSGLGLWLSGSLTLILIFRSLAGAAAATWVDFTILFSSYYKQEETTRSIGIINFYNNIGQLLAMLFGGIIANSFSWKAPFMLGGLAAAVGIIISFFIIEKYVENTENIDLKGIETS
jgi:MFS family permease